MSSCTDARRSNPRSWSAKSLRYFLLCSSFLDVRPGLSFEQDKLLPRSYLLSSFKKNLWPLPLFYFPSLYVSWSLYVALTTTIDQNISLMSGGCWDKSWRTSPCEMKKWYQLIDKKMLLLSCLRKEIWKFVITGEEWLCCRSLERYCAESSQTG